MAARGLHKLSAIEVKRAGAGMHSDGGGLYLQVKPPARSWIFKFRMAGKTREMGMGSASTVTLAKAREKAREAREMVADGRSPIQERDRRNAALAPGVETFGSFGARMVTIWAPGWRTAETPWNRTLNLYCKPIAGIPIADIGTDEVLKVLTPLWQRVNYTAGQVRGRIERILDAARVAKLRSGDNPARWDGHLQHMLSKPQALSRGHHEAMPFKDVPAFVAALQARGSVAALALEFCILTAARSGEVRQARRREIDFDAAIWTAPAEHMKGGRVHRVPLAPRCIEILRKVWGLNRGDDAMIFPAGSRNGGLSNMTLPMLLRRFDGGEYTVHGFRSSFRDWAGDETDFAREVAEAALAHIVGDKAEQAYRRGDALNRRRALMEAWADYVAAKPPVTALPAAPHTP